MIKVSRLSLTIFTLLFALNHAVLGLTWLGVYRDENIAAVSFVIYLAAVIPSIVLYRGIKIPQAQALMNLWAAVVVPLICLALLEINDVTRSGSFATWFVGAVGTLLGVTAVRGYQLFAWIGLAMLWIQVIIWGGPSVIGTSGLVGAVLLVFAGSAVARGFDSTEKQAELYLEQANRTVSQTARLQATRIERKQRVEAALRAALPILEGIIAMDGNLSVNGRIEALLTEAALRDEIQGKNLIDDGVRIAAREARRRGVEVSIIDDGGLDGASAFEAMALRTSVAQAIASTTSGNIAVRAPKGETFMASVTAQRPGESRPDLWLRLP